MCEKRRTISPEDRQKKGEQAAHRFIQSSLFHSSHHIACYAAGDNEFCSDAIIKHIWKMKKNCYLPVLTEKILTFVAYREGDHLKKNRYRILEPLAENHFPIDNIQVVLVPLVAFDLQGNRIGMGAGYYDRTFAFLKKMPERKIRLIGLGYEFQHIEALPHDEWDVPLDGILTEKKLRLFLDHKKPR